MGRPPARPLCRLFAVEILWPLAAGFQFREPIASSWSGMHRARRRALGRLHLGIRPKRAWNPCPDRSATRARGSRSVPLRAEPDVLERDNDRAGRTAPDALAGLAGVLGDLVRSSEFVCDRVRGTDPASPIWCILRAIQPNRRALDTATPRRQTEHLSRRCRRIAQLLPAIWPAAYKSLEVTKRPSVARLLASYSNSYYRGFAGGHTCRSLFAAAATESLVSKPPGWRPT